MTIPELVAAGGLPLATFGYCVASGFVPVLCAELFLIGVAAVTPAPLLGPLAVLAALGQMIGKSGMYLAGAGVLALPLGRFQEKLAAAERRVHAWKSRDLLVLVSAFAGIPPLFAMSVLAGTLRFPFARFAAAGFAGRLLRFGLVLAVPQAARWMLGVPAA
jgi:membrane protein YqaA with SNARE-associated domain